MAKWAVQKEWGRDGPFRGWLHLMSSFFKLCHYWLTKGCGVSEDSFATFYALNSFSSTVKGVVFDTSPQPWGSASGLLQLVDSSVTLAVIV